MPRSHGLVLAVLFLGLVSIPEYGQRRVSPKSEPSLPIYSTVPIDPKATSLPPQFRGVNPEVLYNELERRAKQSKGEFETTEAFNARMRNLGATPLVGTISGDELIPLTLASGTTLLDKITSRYDADNEALGVSIEMSAPVIGVEMDFHKRSVPLRHDVRSSESYVGQNAYGAKVIIQKTYADLYELIILNFQSFKSPRDTESTFGDVITAKLKMSPTEAMTAKPNLRVLALVRLRDPFFLNGYVRHKPTVTEPTDTFGVYQYLVGEVNEFWLYDFGSGRIHAKWRP